MGIRCFRRAVTVLILALAAALLPATASQGTESVEPRSKDRRAPAAGDAQFAPDELIVKWAPDASAGARAQSRERQGLTKVRDLPIIGAEVARVRSGHSPPAAAARARADSRVEYAEPNAVVHSQQAPDDPSFDQLWGLRNTGQEIQGTLGIPGVDVDALTAWQQTRGDADLVVGVIDTGVDIGHPDLAARIWQNPAPGSDPRYPGDLHGWDFFNHDATVFDPQEGDSHGTHVAGTIAAAADNGVGVAGVAPDVQIMPLKFLGPDGSGFLDDAILAIEYARDRGVRVVNASWAGSGFSPALEDAIAASGMVFVAAAGNAARDNDGADPAYPCSYDLANVLCVAAVGNTGDLADFSNFGATTVDVGAPGQDILSTVPTAPASTVALEIDDLTGGYQAMLWGFSFWDVVGADDRRALLAGAVGTHLGAAPDDAILLVDDDESARGYPDARDVYQQALTAAGFTDVAVHEIAPDADGPPAATMAAHGAVVWFTGLAFGSDGITTVTAKDQAELIAYLDGGGRLLLAGEDALFGIESSTLVADSLHADVIAEVEGRPDGEGGPGSVYAGQFYDLSGAESPSGTPSPFVTHVEPNAAAATAALVFPPKPYDDAYAYFNGTSMASPHAAGVAALVASVAPELSAAGVVAHVSNTVTPLDALTGTTLTGGMVDAAAAVDVTALPEPPSAPRSVSAIAGDAQAGVSWLAPTSDGGATITSYTVTAEPGGHTVDVDADTLAATVFGLTNGTAYTFTVTAHNAMGTSPPSSPSAAVTPAAPPSAPRAVSATAGDAQAGVSWLAPTTDGGADITGYTVTAEPGGHTVDVDAGGTLVTTVTGLTNGATYTFTVTAHNAAGSSAPSASSAAVVPAPATACEDRAVPASGFTDIAGNTHEAAIACVVWHGVAQGTSDTTYSPRATVTRAQMASFMARTIAAAGATLPAGEDHFTDVDGNTHEDNIERLAAAGIVQGVVGGLYAPRATVTRAQMASFLARAFAFVDGALLAVAPTAFTDIAGNTHEDNIRRVAGAGFAQGTTATTYSPGAGVRRDQMASFLSRMLERFAAGGRLTEPGL